MVAKRQSVRLDPNNSIVPEPEQQSNTQSPANVCVATTSAVSSTVQYDSDSVHSLSSNGMLNSPSNQSKPKLGSINKTRDDRIAAGRSFDLDSTLDDESVEWPPEFTEILMNAIGSVKDIDLKLAERKLSKVRAWWKRKHDSDISANEDGPSEELWEKAKPGHTNIAVQTQVSFPSREPNKKMAKLWNKRERAAIAFEYTKMND